MAEDRHNTPESSGTLSPTLRRDLPCRCGYNLRGLSAAGRCPECGLDVVAVLVASAGASSPAAPVDPQWARGVRNAIILAMSGDVARSAFPVFVYSLSPPSYSSGSVGVLYVYYSLFSVWWVLQWYAALRLTKLEGETLSPVSVRIVAWALRVTATLYMALPLATLPFEQPTRGVPTTFHWIVRASTMLVSALFFLRMRDICRRLGGVSPAGQAALVALMLPFIMWSSRSWSNWRGRSVFPSSFASLPSYQFGDTVWLWSFVHSFPNNVGSAMSAASNMAIAAGCWVVMVRLLIMAWRIGRAGNDGKNAASSSP